MDGLRIKLNWDSLIVEPLPGRYWCAGTSTYLLPPLWWSRHWQNGCQRVVADLDADLQNGFMCADTASRWITLSSI
jgi:hypothetical protein